MFVATGSATVWTVGRTVAEAAGAVPAMRPRPETTVANAATNPAPHRTLGTPFVARSAGVLAGSVFTGIHLLLDGRWKACELAGTHGRDRFGARDQARSAGYERAASNGQLFSHQ